MIFIYIYFNYFPIFYAILSESLEIVKFFINSGFGSIENRIPENPLHFAAIINNIEIGKFLLEKMDINSTDRQGHSALCYAIKNHSKEFIQFLLQQPGININIQDIVLFRIFFMEFQINLYFKWSFLI